jgi:hypothetical protein
MSSDTSTETETGPQNDAASTSGPESTETPASPASGTNDGEPDTFSRGYVEELRQEAAKNRTSAKRSDELSRRLVVAHAEATGRLHDARDLAVTDDLLDDDGYPDPAKVNDAVDALIKERPHLARIRPVGDVGQGAASETRSSGLMAFGDMLRNAAT